MPLALDAVSCYPSRPLVQAGEFIIMPMPPSYTKSVIVPTSIVSHCCIAPLSFLNVLYSFILFVPQYKTVESAVHVAY